MLALIKDERPPVSEAFNKGAAIEAEDAMLIRNPEPSSKPFMEHGEQNTPYHISAPRLTRPIEYVCRNGHA